MSMSDPLGDMFARIRNGQMRGKDFITCPASKLQASVLEVLKQQGLIRGYERQDVREGISELRVELKYYSDEKSTIRKPVIQELSRVSKPGRRVYSRIKDLQKIRNGLGMSILSTPKGVMTDHDARAANVGGEVLCQIF